MKPSSLPFPIVSTINKGFDAVWAWYSGIVNWWLWKIKYKGMENEVSESKTNTSNSFNGLNTATKIRRIRDMLKLFSWRSDFLDWYPTIETLIASRFRDDCDGAAVYGGFLLSCIGIKSRRVKLIATCGTWKFWKWYGHIIQVSNDNKYFISNNDLVEIKLGFNSTDFEQDVDVKDWKHYVKLYFQEGCDAYDFIL
jgi:hypothetical protein